MAEYVPPGKEFILTSTEITGELNILGNKNFIKQFDDKNIIITECYIEDHCGLSKQIIKYSICMRSPSPWYISSEISLYYRTLEIHQKLKKLGSATFNLKKNYDSYDHNGYVKRDVTKYHNISEEEKVRLWDILTDKDGNEWEVTLLNNKTYYCDLCDEIENEWVEKDTFLFKLRKEANDKYRELCSNSH